MIPNGISAAVLVFGGMTLFGAALQSEGQILQYGALGVLAGTILLAYKLISRGIDRISAISDDCHKQAEARETRIMHFAREEREQITEFIRAERTALERIIARCPFREG